MTDVIKEGGYRRWPGDLGWEDERHNRRLRTIAGRNGWGWPQFWPSFTRVHLTAGLPVAAAASALALVAAAPIGLPLLFPCGVGKFCHVAEKLDDILQVRPVLDAAGAVIGYANDPWGPPVRREQAPLCLDALRNKEDYDLYDRTAGFDLKGIARAVRDNLMAGAVVSGASTYEQQIARTVFPLAWTGLRRKLAEASLATRMRMRYTAGDIEAMYAAVVYVGRDIHGLEPAAHSYFGRPLAGLSAGECALLSTLPAAPARRDPERFYTSADSARRFGLTRMLAFSLITKPVMLAELQKPIEYLPALPASGSALGTEVREEASRCKLGPEELRTTLNSRLQDLLTTEQRHLATRRVVFDAIAMRPNGAVLAWVGEPRVAAEIGSLLKPFEAAIGDETGLAPLETLVADLPWPTGGSREMAWLAGQRKRCLPVATIRDALGPSDRCAFIRLHTKLAAAGALGHLGEFGLPAIGSEPANALGLVQVPLTRTAEAFSVFSRSGAMGAAALIPGCSLAPRPAPLRPGTANRVQEALRAAISGGGTLAGASARFWPGQGRPIWGKTGSAARTHTVVVATPDLVLALRIRSDDPLHGTAAGTVGPAAFRTLRRFYADRS